MSAQMGLFGDPAAPTAPVALPQDPSTPQGLRPYQEEAVQGVLRELEDNRSTMFVMATGSGKTRVLTEIAKRRKSDRILLLAHRDELLQQARARFAHDCEEYVGLDQAQELCGDQRIVVASVQTISRQDRLNRLRPDRFDLVMIDECHHAPATTYKRVMDYFANAKILGCTATPDRADEKAMGQVFDSVAYIYEIEDAIRDGYLCEVTCSRIEIAGLDLSSVKTTAGDLNQGELDAVMKVEQNLLAVADATIREAGTRQTVVFTTSVDNAQRIAEIMNRYRTGPALIATDVNGKTETSIRRDRLERFQSGEFQFLVNVQIATEGWDCPPAACIAMARPTKSRALYAQCVGRGLRPHPSKPDGCLILDFVGNSGRHKLASALDVLGGKYSEDEEEIAQEIVAKNPGMKARDALEQARMLAERKKREAEEAAKRAAIKAHAIYTKQAVNPFGVYHMKIDREEQIANRFGGRPPTEKQLAALERFKIPVPEACTLALASKLISTAIIRSQKHLATFGQLKTLQRYGINEINLAFDTASSLIDAIKQNGWKPLPFGKLDSLLARNPTPEIDPAPAVGPKPEPKQPSLLDRDFDDF